MSTSLRVCGRAHEAGLLAARVDDLLRGEGAVVLVTGAAGIGKSLLLASLCDLAVSAGADAIHGTARELEHVRPFGVFVDALGVRGDVPAVVEVLSLLRGEHVSEDRFLAQDRLLDLLERTALTTPTVVVLDDLQWVDAASQAVITRLAVLAADVPLLVALASRPHAGADTLRSLAAHQLELRPLGPAAVAELIELRTGRTPGSRLLALIERAGGNPLFVQEILRELERDGTLIVDGESVESSSDALPLSARQAILSRLAFLSEEALEVLRIAAVIGATFTVSDVATVVGRSASELSGPINESWRAGVVVADREAMRFQHDIVHEAVYTDLPESLRTALHLDVGRALAAVGAPAAQVAAHLSRGARRGDEAAIRWVGAAASEAASGAPAVAAALLERLIELLPDDDPRRAGAFADLALNRLAGGDVSGAERAVRSILAMDADLTDITRAERLLVRMLQLSARFPEAIEVAERLAACEALAPVERAHVMAELAVTTNMVDVHRASALADDAIACAAEAESAGAMFRSLATATGAAFLRGDFEVARDFSRRCEESTSAAVAQPDTGAGNAAFVARGVAGPTAEGMCARFACDELDFALSNGRSVLHSTEALGLRELVPFVQVTLALFGYVAGRWDDARADAEATIAVTEDTGTVLLRRLASSVAARIAMHRDQTDDADAWIARATAERGEANVYEGPLLEMARAAVLASHGRAAEAAEASQRAWNEIVRTDALGVGRMCATEHVRLTLAADRTADDVLEAMDDVRRRSPNIRSLGAIVDHCRGLIDRQPDPILAAARTYHEVDALVDAMSAFEDAGTLYAASRRTSDAVVALGEALDRAVALGATLDSRRIAARLRGLGVRRGVRGARGRPSTGWASLTEGELRVVELAAAGLTNRQMGERLYLSRRTVESHLAHVYRKLGVSTRAELGRCYGERPEVP